MPKTLLYRSSPRWQTWLAFGVASALHFAVVAVANVKHPITENLTNQLGDEVTGTIEPLDATPQEYHPLPDHTLLPVPETTSDFPDESSVPTPQIRKPRRTSTLSQNSLGKVSGAVSISAAKAIAISAPRPEYPYEARSRHIMGSGICVMIVDTSSGYVSDVTVAESTGSSVLDNSAVSAFRRWRFKPDTVSRVRVPITFTLTGAQ